jgi:hypothetical protein
MDWTLLVPGALVAPRLAPELARALDAPLLAAQLRDARAVAAGPGRAATAHLAPEARQAVHWAWLAGHFGLDPAATATAPYAWHWIGDATADVAADAEAVAGADVATGAVPDAEADLPADRADATLWVAYCTPVHLAIARDHFVVSDLGAAPLQDAEARELLDRANAVLAAEPPAARGAGEPPLRLAQRGGTWFLLAPQPLELQTWQLDAVLGQSVQDRLPVGPAARRWRVLVNEIQMSWHASASAAAREDAGARAANALWLHGGGRWSALALPTGSGTALRMAGAVAEDAVVRGWLQAGGVAAPAQAPTATLAVCRALFSAHAHQAWESWLEAWPAVEARLDAELDAARQAGARRFELVLCGAHGARVLALPLRTPWWHRLRRPTPAAAIVQRWLAEPAPPAASARTGGAHAGASHRAAA